MKFEYLKAPINKYTFKTKKIREYVESKCEGHTLNLFAGSILLEINELRNDTDETMKAEYHLDALEFMERAVKEKMLFNTFLLDPPYSYRKSMEFYNGNKNSRFKLVKDRISEICPIGGLVITFGYNSVNMGINRGFELVELCIINHGGAIHDTLCGIEKRIK